MLSEKKRRKLRKNIAQMKHSRLCSNGTLIYQARAYIRHAQIYSLPLVFHEFYKCAPINCFQIGCSNLGEISFLFLQTESYDRLHFQNTTLYAYLSPWRRVCVVCVCMPEKSKQNRTRDTIAFRCRRHRAIIARFVSHIFDLYWIEYHSIRTNITHYSIARVVCVFCFE